MIECTSLKIYATILIKKYKKIRVDTFSKNDAALKDKTNLSAQQIDVFSITRVQDFVCLVRSVMTLWLVPINAYGSFCLFENFIWNENIVSLNHPGLHYSNWWRTEREHHDNSKLKRWRKCECTLKCKFHIKTY